MSTATDTLVANRPCSIAGLLAVVLGYTLEESYARCGLLLCPICQTASRDPTYYPCCNAVHWRKHTFTNSVILTCVVCEAAFPKKVSELASQARVREKRGMGTVGNFCSKPCQGKWFGATHGVQKGTHVRNNAHSTECKYGHPFSEMNTYHYIDRLGFRTRQCRICNRRRSNEK